MLNFTFLALSEIPIKRYEVVFEHAPPIEPCVSKKKRTEPEPEPLGPKSVLMLAKEPFKSFLLLFEEVAFLMK